MVLDRALTFAREKRTKLPNLAWCLEVFDSINRELATDAATREVSGANDNGSWSADPNTAAFHEQLIGSIGKTSFQSWQCRELHLVSVEQDRVIFSVPNAVVGTVIRNQFKNRFEAQLLATAERALGCHIEHVEIITRDAAAGGESDGIAEASVVGDFRVEATPAPPTPGPNRREAVEPRIVS